VESDAFSVPEVAAGAGDCLTGVSSLMKSGSMMARSFWEGTLRVTTWLGLGEPALATIGAAELADLRRSLAAAAFLLEGAIAASKIASNTSMRRVERWFVGGWMGNDDDGDEDEGVVEGENLLCHGDDALAQAWMAREDGRSTGWACKGRTQSAWGENLPYRLLASHFYFASATAATGWFAGGRR
jgi:hypothetical protein